MKIEPIFCGKVKITEVKNGQWSWQEFKTKLSDDKKIFDLAQKICSKEDPLERQNISAKSGKTFITLLENIIGKSLNLSNNEHYSMLRTKGQLFFYSEKPQVYKFDDIENSMIDRIGIDISI